MQDGLTAVAVTGYLLAAMVWPTLRVWRRTGVWPVVFHRRAAPAQRLLGALFALVLAGLPLALLRLTQVGREAMGVWPAPLGMTLAGWLGLAGGTAITLTAQRQMGAAWRIGIDDRLTVLVTGGLFRYSRNPVFLGLGLFLAGVACLAPAWWSLAGVLTALAAIRLQVIWEECHLAALHGRAYRDYAGRTGRFVPGLGRLRALGGEAPAAPKGR